LICIDGKKRVVIRVRDMMMMLMMMKNENEMKE